MSFRILTVLVVALLTAAGPLPAFAQNADPSAADKAKDAAKDTKKPDDLMEASKAIDGPAGNPECIWLGRRAVSLLWRDDLDTAFRHLDLYDRFGCPGGHIQSTFRCVVRQGYIDPKAPETLGARVTACWINPSTPPTSASATPPANTGTSSQ